MTLPRPVRTALGIAREMVPSADLIVKAAIRAIVGASLIYVWAFAGKFFFMMAAITLVGHAEGVFASHASDWIRRQIVSVYFLCLIVAGIVVVAMRPPSRGFDRDQS